MHVRAHVRVRKKAGESEPPSLADTNAQKNTGFTEFLQTGFTGLDDVNHTATCLVPFDDRAKS